MVHLLHVDASNRFHIQDRNHELSFVVCCPLVRTSRLHAVARAEATVVDRNEFSAAESRDRRLQVPGNAVVTKARGHAGVAIEALDERTKRILLRTRRNTQGRKERTAKAESMMMGQASSTGRYGEKEYMRAIRFHSRGFSRQSWAEYLPPREEYTRRIRWIARREEADNVLGAVHTLYALRESCSLCNASGSASSRGRRPRAVFGSPAKSRPRVSS